MDLKKLLEPFVTKRRENYLRKKRAAFHAGDVSIIASDCAGGISYHDLGLRFLSPTINMYFSSEDFIELLENLEYYLNSAPVEVLQTDYDYPVGKISRGDESVTIHFVHFDSFESARAKWIERSERVNLEKIFIIWHHPGCDAPPRELVSRFEKLPYKNKLLITGAAIESDKMTVRRLNIYDKNYYNGKHLSYKNGLSEKRFLDDCGIDRLMNEAFR